MLAIGLITWGTIGSAPALSQTVPPELGARCFSVSSRLLMETLPTVGAAPRPQPPGDPAAATSLLGDLCEEAAAKYGALGVDCFEQALDAARGMSALPGFAGMAGVAYTEKYRRCTGG